MKRKKTTLVILVVSLIFSLVALYIRVLCSISDSYPFSKLTNDNTSELFATLVQVEERKVSYGSYFIIHTYEYGDMLRVGAESVLFYDYLLNLPQNQTIRFRLEDTYFIHLDDLRFVNIVALETEEKEIVTLESCNRKRDKEEAKMKTMTGEPPRVWWRVLLPVF